jgi:hypothetical protein
VIAADEQRQHDEIQRTIREKFGNVVIFQEPAELEDTPEFTDDWKDDADNEEENGGDGGFLWEKKK